MSTIVDPDVLELLGESSAPVDTDIAHLDFETYCELDIRKVGGHRYARHSSCEVLIAAYLLPGMAQPAVWLPRTETPPKDLVRWVAKGGKIGAHNANFERNVWRYALSRQHEGIPEIADEQWVCTAAKAAAAGLPRSLEKALQAVDAGVEKDEEGAKLIQVFCKPKKATKKDPRTRILPEQDARFQRFVQYCRQDVRGEVVLDQMLPDLIPRERRMFLLDMLMNDRGLPIDVPLVGKTLRVVQALEKEIASRVAELTISTDHVNGLKATQGAKMLELFQARGLEMENMQKGTIEALLKNEDIELDEDTRLLLELRIEASKASTKKLVSMLACADPDDWVVQGGFLFHGAHTGRYAGRLVQPHNFIRGLLKDRQRDLVFELLQYADPDLFLLLYDKPINTISQCMRGFIKAPAGYELAVVDYTAIEARILAWLCDQEDMLEEYRKGTDVYKLMASQLFKVAIEDVSDEQRRMAKNLVLGCGYQLGGDRFVEYCAALGVVVDPVFAAAAVKFYRKSVPKIVESWKVVEKLVVCAIQNPGTKVSGLKCRFFMEDHWLCIQLPSGRCLKYPHARVTLTERYDRPHWQISFKTEYKGRFLRETTYGGKLIENIVQAIARDVMMEGMLAAEEGGWPVIGTVHDELLTLVKKGMNRIKELEKVVCVGRLKWVKGMPLAAKGFVTIRYKKD